MNKSLNICKNSLKKDKKRAREKDRMNEKYTVNEK